MRFPIDSATKGLFLQRALVGALVLTLAVLAGVTVVNFARSTTDENVFVTSPSHVYVRHAIPARWLRPLSVDRFEATSHRDPDSLRAGDLIFGVGGKRVMALADLRTLIGGAPSDSFIELDVVHVEGLGAAAFTVKAGDLSDDAIREIQTTVAVTDVTPGGASDRAGMLVGDLIFKINGKTFTTDIEADQILRRAQIGKTITYDVYRGDRELTLHITVAEFGLQFLAILLVIAGIVNFAFGAFLALKRPDIMAARLLGISFILLGFFFMVFFTRRDVASLFVSIRDALVYLAFFLSWAFHTHATQYFPRERPEMIGRKWIPITLYSLAVVISIVTGVVFNGGLAPMLILLLLFWAYWAFLVFWFRKSVTPEYKRLNRAVRVGSLGLSGLVVLLAVLSAYFKIGIDFRMVAVPMIIFPFLYLYAIGRHRLLDMNLRIRRNLQYTFVSVAWGIAAAVIFCALLSIVLNIDLRIPVVIFTGTSVEVTDTPASPEVREAVRRALAVVLGIAAWYLMWRIRKKVQALIDGKYYRTHYDYRSASEQLVDVMATHVGMVELGRGIVEKLASLMQVKRAAVLFFRDEKTCCCQEASGIGAAEWENFCCETGDALPQALRKFQGEIRVDYLPDDLKAVFRKHGFHYLVPIRSQEKLIGTFVLGEKLSESTYSQEDLAFLSAAAKQASVAIENAFLYEEVAEKERMKHELEIARKIQLASLPQVTPTFAGLDIAGLSKPAQEVGGDFFDYLNGTPGNLTVVVGDVSGKGTSAALYMSKVQGILRSLHGFDLSPGPLFVRANRLLCADLEKKSFVTAVGASFEVGARRLQLARAGHLPLYRFDAATRRVEAVIPRGLGLGLNNEDLFVDELEERTLQYAPGDVLLFVTDGVTEARNARGEEFGQDRLMHELSAHASRSAGQIRDHLFADLAAFSSDQPQHDDQTIVVVKAVEMPPHS